MLLAHIRNLPDSSRQVFKDVVYNEESSSSSSESLWKSCEQRTLHVHIVEPEVESFLGRIVLYQSHHAYTVEESVFHFKSY